MSKHEVQHCQLQLETYQKFVDGALFLKRTYADRRKSLVTRIAESTRALEALDREHATVDKDLEESRASVEHWKQELVKAKYGDKIDAVLRIQEQLKKLGRKT